jgi:hypothetical protein
MPTLKYWDGTSWQSVGGGIALVSALPGVVVDGQECYYQNAAMATAGVIWHFRYRNAKWEFLGGGILAATQASAGGTQSTANVSTVAAMTNTPSLVTPLAGFYRICAAGAILGGAAGPGDARVFVCETGASVSRGAQFNWPSTAQGGTVGLDCVNALSAGTTLDLRISTNNVLASFGNPSRWTMSIEPIWVN